MMKKLSRFIALILALVTVFLVPVSASDVDNTASWENVLDYATLNDSGCNYIQFSNSTTVRFDTKKQSLVRFVDILVNSAGSDITSASINGNSLTVLPLDSQVFRIYGQVSNILTGVYDLTFTSDGTCYLDIIQFSVNGQWRLVYDDVGYFVLDWENAAGHTYSTTYTMPNSTTPVYSSLFGEAIYDNFDQTSQPLPYKILFSSTNWRKYDRLDFHFRVKVHSIDSISVTCGDSFLPYSISAYTAPSVGNAESNMHNFYTDNVSAEYESTIWWSDNFADRTVDICISIDLAGIDRTSTLYPKITIHGKTFNEPSNRVSLIRTVGHVYTDSIDPFLHYFRIYADSQFAYYDDILTQHRNMYSLITTGLRSLSADIISSGSHVAKVISDFQSALTVKLTNFQTSIENWFSTISGKLDQLIGGTSEGDELSQDAENLEDQISDVHDFEQEQQEILDNALPDMQQAVAVTKFSSALAFVQHYINMGWLALGDFTIIYTLPIFIGLFFFICGRLPGVTRWSYKPPKGGGSK